MYAGKTQAKLNEEKLKRKREAAKAEMEKNTVMVHSLLKIDQGNLWQISVEFELIRQKIQRWDQVWPEVQGQVQWNVSVVRCQSHAWYNLNDAA